MKNCELLSREQINSVYSKQEYFDHIKNKKHSSRVASYPLHYMIALNFSQTACLAYSRKHKDCLASRDSKLHFVTPLMLAILLEKKGMVQGLARLMTEEDFRVLDAFGFNALHLASLVLPSVVDLLKKKADLLQFTPLNASYRLLSILAGHSPAEKSKFRFQVMDKMGQLQDGSLLSPKDLRKLMGIRKLCEIPLFDSPEGRRYLWQKQKPFSDYAQLIFINFFESKIKEYKLSPPKLIVKPSSNLSLLKRSLGLFVEEKIAAFTKISGYGGRFKHSKKKSYYVLDKFDGRDIGGLAAFANCGFPNSKFMVFQYDGCVQYDLFSICSISPEEEILVSYGYSYYPLRFGRQVLLGVDKLETFFKNFKIIQKKSNTNAKDLLDSPIFNQNSNILNEAALREQATFPIIYPNYLLHLWAKNIKSAQFWLNAIKGNKFSYSYQNEDEKDFMEASEIVQAHCKILLELEAFEKKDIYGYIPTLKNWILKRIGIFSYIELIFATIITKHEIISKRLNGDNFQNFFQSLLARSRELLLAEWKDKPSFFLKDTLHIKELEE